MSTASHVRMQGRDRKNGETVGGSLAPLRGDRELSRMIGYNISMRRAQFRLRSLFILTTVVVVGMPILLWDYWSARLLLVGLILIIAGVISILRHGNSIGRIVALAYGVF